MEKYVDYDLMGLFELFDIGRFSDLNYDVETDVYSTRVMLEVPGIDKANIKILEGVEHDSRAFTIEISGKQPRYFSFKLANGYDLEKTSAHLKNGVLTLNFPKVQGAKPREIPITE